MSVLFNNKWFRETCEAEGWNPDGMFTQSSIVLARERAVDMKLYMDAKKNYPDVKLQKKFDEQIKRLDEERVGYMLNALLFAEVSAENGVNFDRFLERHINQRKHLLR